MGEKIHRIRSINGRYKIDRGKVKNSIGKGEAKELICMTHGHAWKWGGNYWREWGFWAEEVKGEKMGQL